ncbi:MAG: hypothetical protein INR62_03925 [Rhodospirillales bacterium]|nr:hypothetical protein [Acetobacter sp.]
MMQSFSTGAALRQARRIGSRARELRRELRDYTRGELFRIRLAEKRARGLRLYAAWSRPTTPTIVSSRAAVWRGAESAA